MLMSLRRSAYQTALRMSASMRSRCMKSRAKYFTSYVTDESPNDATRAKHGISRSTPSTCDAARCRTSITIAGGK